MADKELQKVRTEFVDRVSTEVIKQLLDCLLNDGVLNDGEVESILEENHSRADQARKLIDKVKKKGAEASKKMIAHLQDKDKNLYSVLGVSGGPPAQPDKRAALAAPPPTTVREFWVSKKDDPEIYPVTETSFKSRVALLINNIEFTDETKNRSGAEKDEENMEKLLSSLGYEVVKFTNLTGQEIDDAVIYFSKHPKLKQTDSVFVVIMSHGLLGKIQGVKWRKDNPDEFPIDNLFKHLGSNRCPALIDKPKIIIIQACRGGNKGSVMVSDGPNTADDVQQLQDFEEDKIRFVHQEKDFISLLSCTPNTMAYRQTGRGSILIQCIVEVFTLTSYQEHILELFKKVMQRVESFRCENELQMATIDRCTLIKNFYIFQGLLNNSR